VGAIKPRAISDRDTLAGVVIAALGAVLFVLSNRFSIGGLNNPGPGFFPLVVSVLLFAIGAVITVRGWLTRSQHGIPTLRLRSLLAAVALASFGGLVDQLGLVLAGAALLVVAALAGHKPRPLETVALVLVLVPVSVAIFVFALGQRMPLWP
jgi:hypothetical protein